MVKNTWLIFQLFNSLSSTILGLFLSIYVWQKTGSLEFIYLYHLALFISIPFFGLLSGFLSNKYSFKYSFFVSIITQVLFLYLIISNPDLLIKNPVIFGLISSFSIAFYAISRNSLFQILNKENISGGNSILNSLGSIISLSVPLLGSWSVILTGGYNLLFWIALFSLVLSLFFNFILRIPEGGSKFDLSIIQKFSKTNDFNKLQLIYFLNGIKNGIEWPLMGVILLNLIGGDLNNWGFVNSLAATIGIMIGFVFSKYLSNRFEKPTLYLSSILYTVFGTFLFINFNLTNFLIFILGTTITSNVIGPSFSKLVNDVYQEITIDGNNTTEFYYISEIPLNIGRVLSLGILFFFNFDLNSKVVLGLMLFLISSIPFVSTYIIQKTKVFSVNNQ